MCTIFEDDVTFEQTIKINEVDFLLLSVGCIKRSQGLDIIKKHKFKYWQMIDDAVGFSHIRTFLSRPYVDFKTILSALSKIEPGKSYTMEYLN